MSGKRSRESEPHPPSSRDFPVSYETPLDQAKAFANPNHHAHRKFSSQFHLYKCLQASVSTAVEREEPFAIAWWDESKTSVGQRDSCLRDIRRIFTGLRIRHGVWDESKHTFKADTAHKIVISWDGEASEIDIICWEDESPTIPQLTQTIEEDQQLERLIDGLEHLLGEGKEGEMVDI